MTKGFKSNCFNYDIKDLINNESYIESRLEDSLWKRKYRIIIFSFFQIWNRSYR